MLIFRTFASAALFLTTTLPAIEACPGAQNNSSEAFVMGNDGSADVETLGYAINHMALVVNDLGASMHFYGKVLGMRHIFTYHASDTYSLVYMGYSQGGKNGTGYQTGAELYREKQNMAGMIEFLYHSDCNTTTKPDSEASTTLPNTFSHIGLVVPDIVATEKRMREYGVNILKPVGGLDIPYGGDVSNAFGFDEATNEETDDALAGITDLGFRAFLLATDPDGNLLEIQPQI